MSRIKLQFAGVELYFEDLEQARRFYVETLAWRSPMSKRDITSSLTVAQDLSAWNEEAWNPIRQRTRLCSFLKGQI